MLTRLHTDTEQPNDPPKAGWTGIWIQNLCDPLADSKPEWEPILHFPKEAFSSKKSSHLLAGGRELAAPSPRTPSRPLAFRPQAAALQAFALSMTRLKIYQCLQVCWHTA